MAPERMSLSSIWPVLIPLVVFLLAWLGYLNALPYVQLPYDDSYIAQQYARHLLATGALTFDGENPSGGATSTPHVFLLALARQLTSSPVRAALLIGFLFHVGFLLVLYSLMCRLGLCRRVSAVAASAGAGCGFLVTDSLNGLETSMFHFFGTALIWQSLRVRKISDFILLVLVLFFTCWCRPEGLLLAGAFMLPFLWRLHGEHLPSGQYRFLAAALVLVPLVLFLGHFRPGHMPSWRVKMSFYGESCLPVWEKIRLAAPGIAAFGYFLRWYLAIPLLAAMWVCASRVLPLLSGRGSVDRPVTVDFPAWLAVLMITFAAAFYGAYTWCLPSSLFYLDFRYQHILLPWLFVLVGWGWQVLERSVESRWVGRSISALLVMAVFLGSVMTYIGSRSVYIGCVRSIQNVLIPLAGELRKMSRLEDAIAAHDVGVLGYYSGRRMIDLVGLTNPAPVLFRKEVSAKGMRDYVRAAGSGFLVIHPSWDDLYLHIRPDNPGSGFRFLFETRRAFGDRYRVYRFGYSNEAQIR